MQALKSLVIFMGILILVGLGLVAYGVMQQGGKLGGAPETTGERPAAPVPTTAPTPARAFGEVALALPAGCSIGEATSAEGRLLVRLSGPLERGCQQVVVFDLQSGNLLGRLLAAPQP